MDFTLIFDYRNNEITGKTVTGTVPETVVNTLQRKTTEYLQHEKAPACKVEFHTEADHIPHVTLHGLDNRHLESLTSILNACIK